MLKCSASLIFASTNIEMAIFDQPRTAGFSFVSHHWRKLVGVVFSGVRGSALSIPSFLARAMSVIP